MRRLIWLTLCCQLATALPALGDEVRPLADCTVKVFRDIAKNRAWTGKLPAGCSARVYVEQRPTGVFVTAWRSGVSKQGWIRLSFSAAMGVAELADTKALKRAGRDITARAGRIGRCLDSIIRVNDPLECRDSAVKSYLAGETLGTEYVRNIWLDDNGRHSVVEYAYGDSLAAVSPPADLFAGPALPPGTRVNLHLLVAP